MKLIDRITNAVDALKGSAGITTLGNIAPEVKRDTMHFPRGYNTWGGYYFNSTLERNVDYNKEVDLSASSIVMSVINWLGTTLPEAPLQVLETDAEGQTNIVPKHELVSLLRRPNPYHTGAAMWTAFAYSWVMDGNHYLLKIRDGRGQVVELWYLPHFMVEPRWPKDDNSVFISHYEYTVDGRKYNLGPEDVIHFRKGIDPHNTRKGLAPLKAGLREIYGDEKASQFSAALMRNFGVISYLISPKEGHTIDEKDAPLMKASFIKNTTGENAGQPMVNTIPLEVARMGFNPKELELTELRMIPEERIPSLLGIPPIVVGFIVGLRTGTFSNYGQAREQAYESMVIPTQRQITETLDSQVLPDFSNGREQMTKHDLTQVRVLQEDEDNLYRRLNIGVMGGWLKVSEARTATGWPSTLEDEIYLRRSAPPPASENTPGGDSTPPKGITDPPPDLVDRVIKGLEEVMK